MMMQDFGHRATKLHQGGLAVSGVVSIPLEFGDTIGYFTYQTYKVYL